MSGIPANPPRPRASPINDPKIRGIVYQLIAALLISGAIYMAVSNAVENLTRQKIASGFGFWNSAAGFDIGQHFIPYSTASTYGQAFWVGLLNTLVVAAVGIVLATLLGFSIGIMRLSSNWTINRFSTLYVEIFRNTPLLLQLLFWYNAVLKALPEKVAQSIHFPGAIYLNRRGLVLPSPVVGSSFSYVLLVAGIAVAVGAAYAWRAKRRQELTGRQSPVARVVAALVIGLPLATYFATGMPLGFSAPTLGKFNITGGVQIYPEFVALLLSLTIYTAAFIAEAVRAGIQSVHRGQTEAAYALGLRPRTTLKLVIIPQAMRVIFPPLISQYLNLLKNSSLAVTIGYPDLVQVFAGTVLNQTGQAVEVISITMAVYLTISLITSAGMNLYSVRSALVER